MQGSWCQVVIRVHYLRHGGASLAWRGRRSVPPLAWIGKQI